MDTQIYVRRKSDASQQEGPFTAEEFLERMDTREVHFGDYAWKSGLPNWVLAGSLALAFRPRSKEESLKQPPELVFERRLPTSELAQRELFLRLDAVQVCPDMSDECVEVIMPLNIVLCPNPQQPGGRLWRRLAADWTQLFAARIRFEQAGLLHAHPVRVLLGEKSLDGELFEDEIALMACEELKRRAVTLGADMLVKFSVRFEFVVDGTHPSRAAVPLVIASGLAGLTAETAEARRAKTWFKANADSPANQADPAVESEALKAQLAELAERQRQIDDREAFLMDAEARLMQKIEEQQVREVELDHQEDMLRSRGADITPNTFG